MIWATSAVAAIVEELPSVSNLPKRFDTADRFASERYKLPVLLRQVAYRLKPKVVRWLDADRYVLPSQYSITLSICIS